MEDIKALLTFSLLFNAILGWAWYKAMKSNDDLIESSFLLIDEICSLRMKLMKLERKEDTVA